MSTRGNRSTKCLGSCAVPWLITKQPHLTHPRRAPAPRGCAATHPAPSSAGSCREPAPSPTDTEDSPHTEVRFCRDPTLSWLSAPGQAASSERIPGGTVPHGAGSRALRGRVSSLYQPCYPAPRRNRRNGLKKASKKTDVEFCTCQAKNQPPPDHPCRSSLLALNPREQTGWNKDPSPSLPSLLLPQRPGSEAGHVS